MLTRIECRTGRPRAAWANQGAKALVVLAAVASMAACAGRAFRSPLRASAVGPPIEAADAEVGGALEGFDFSGARARLVVSDWRWRSAAATDADDVGAESVAVVVAADAVRAAPEEATGWIALAKALTRVGSFAAARACAAAATDLAPERAAAWTALGQVDRLRGDLPGAVRAWREALVRTPVDGLLHSRLASALWLLDDFEAARREARLAVAFGGVLPAQLLALADDLPPASAKMTDRTAGDSGPVIHEPVRVDGSGTAQAAEVSLAAIGNRVVIGWNDEREGGTTGKWRLGAARSVDGGLTWQEQLLRPPGGATTFDFQGDPMTAADPVTGNLWVGGMDFGGGGQVYLARWPAGAAGLAAPVTVADHTDDKPLVAVGPVPGQPAARRLHVISLSGAELSADLGATWSATVPLGDAVVSPVPRVGSDGKLYVVYVDFDDGVWLRRSLDGGVTFEPAVRIATKADAWPLQDGSRFPGQFRVAQLAGFALDPTDQTLYAIWPDTSGVVGSNRNVDLYLSRSRDRGLTWSTPRAIGTDVSSSGDQFHPWLEVDLSGRVHLLWFDTRNTVQDDGTEHGMVDVYYAWSEDDGDSWTEARLTDSSFDSADAVWTNDHRQFLGDYLGIAVTGERAYLGYPTTASGDLDLFVQRVDIEPGPPPACEPSATSLCLAGGRFRVEAHWQTPQGQQGAGHAVALTADTGYFWFFDAANVEQVVKVLSGCGLNQRWWVFAGGLTNVRVVTTVTDTATGAVQTYVNPLGTAFRPLQDTAAFATCP